VKKPQHPFKAYLLKEHIHEETFVGDLARDVRLDLAFPTEGGRRELRRYLQDAWGAHNDALLDALLDLDEAWVLFEPDGSPADHPFTTWLLKRDDRRDDTPLGRFARDYADVFPSAGDRDGLRAALAASFDSDDPWADWMLTCFDMSWEQYIAHEAGELL
jgi:uncharacterized protein YozE (UPF0346 family)